MNTIIDILFVLIIFCVGYWRGVVSGSVLSVKKAFAAVREGFYRHWCDIRPRDQRPWVPSWEPKTTNTIAKLGQKCGHKKYNDYIGPIEAVYADYWAALECGIIPYGWFEAQHHKPTTKEQPFYTMLICNDSNECMGAVLVSEEHLVVLPTE